MRFDSGAWLRFDSVNATDERPAARRVCDLTGKSLCEQASRNHTVFVPVTAVR